MRLQHVLCVAAQRVAGRGGKHGVGTYQQLRAYFVFQLLDMGRDVGLNGVQLLGGRTKVAAVADSLEHAQGFELHAVLQYLNWRFDSSF
jgi:hypothetical protein